MEKIRIWNPGWKKFGSGITSRIRNTGRFEMQFLIVYFDFFPPAETVDPSWPRLVLSGNLPRLQLHFNEEKVFTLKHFLGRLLNPDSTTSSAASLGGGEARSRPASPVPAADETLALFNDWQPGGDVDLSARLFVAQFLVSDLSVEIQSQVRIEMYSRYHCCGSGSESGSGSTCFWAIRIH